MNKKKEIKTTIKKENSTDLAPKRPLLIATIKSLVALLIIGAGLYYSDSKGYFNPDQSNNHTLKKWDWFYKFSERNNVDVLLVGNSHLYSGVNPKNLSAALGANAFIIASPGTHIGDTYFGLKEALENCNPKLVVVETYGISDFNPFELKNGGLSDQFKSFSARRDLWVKASSTPFLFKTGNYPYAWSNTIRNHDFIFNNTDQLDKNLKLMEKRKKKKKDKLYLGRFVRFTKGLKDSVQNLYKTKGAPVDGAEYAYSEYAEDYVGKIVKMCESKGIELLFLTVPMYKDHVKDYQSWKAKLNGLLSGFQKPWFDLQLPVYDSSYQSWCFENTYSANQHLTYKGSLITTYKLASFIKDSMKVELPARNKDQKWNTMFYGEEGYFENYSIKADDKENILLAKDKRVRNISLDEVMLINTKKKNRKKFMVKVNRDSINGDAKNARLILALKIKSDGKEQAAKVNLKYDILHETKKSAIYIQTLKPIEVLEILDGMIVFDKKK